MSIQDVFNKYKGQSLLVPGADPADAGQCVQAADYFLHEAYGLPYVWLNAIDWYRNPDANLKTNFDFIPYSPTMPIKIGDFVIYGTGVGSPYGHISTAIQDGQGNNYLGGDSNWGHNLTLHAQPHNDSYNQYILGILRRKGNNGVMADSTLTPEEIDLAIKIAFNRPASSDEIKRFTGANTKDVLLTLLTNNLSQRTKASEYDALQAKYNALEAQSGYKPYAGPQLFVKG